MIFIKKKLGYKFLVAILKNNFHMQKIYKTSNKNFDMIIILIYLLA